MNNFNANVNEGIVFEVNNFFGIKGFNQTDGKVVFNKRWLQ